MTADADISTARAPARHRDAPQDIAVQDTAAPGPVRNPAREPARETDTTAPGNAPPAVELTGVRKTFGHAAPVLDRMELQVRGGEFVCLLGASGCGKSTVLNLLAGLEQPSAGNVLVPGGRPALMFQEHALFPWLTAGRNVELALRLRNVPRRRRRLLAEELLDLVRLGSAHHSRIHQLSGGMRQRVALARALAQTWPVPQQDDERRAAHQAAPVLLMDEPFAALDEITRDLLHEELTRAWAGTGISVLFVTHNVREAVRLGQRVVLLSSRPGRVARQWRVDATPEPEPTRPGELAGGAPEPERPPARTGTPGAAAALHTEITAALREEIRRHAHP